jgi:hypothetical protein
MEKYSAFNDKASGVNPFVPTRLPKSGFATEALGALLCILRLPFVLVIVVLIAIADVLDVLVSPIPLLRSLFRMLLRAPLARLLLGVFGFW